MHIQAVFTREAPPALRTRVRTLSGVDSDVTNETSFLCEPLFTLRAGEGVFGFCSLGEIIFLFVQF